MADEHNTVEHVADAAEHAVDMAHGAEAGGAAMPQLDPTTFSNQIFWLLVTLVVIYLILSKIALPRIAAVLAERSGTITNDLAAAEELKAKAVAAEEAYNKALADARSEAARIVDETKAEIQSQLNAELAKADDEIAAKTAEGEKSIAAIRDNALSSVTDVATETAAALVAALGGQADDKAIAAAVAAQMKG